MNPSGQWATGPPNMPGVPARPVQQQQQPRVPQQGPPPPGMAHGPPMHMQHHGMPRPMHAPMQLPLPGQMPMTAPLTLPPPMPAQPVPGLLLPGPNEPLFLPPGTATLAEDLDKKLLIVLRDGRKFIGIFRSYDQFANVILQNAIERIYVGNEYGDEPRGLYIVRGDNIVLMGEVDDDKEAALPLRRRPFAEMQALLKQRQGERFQTDRMRNRALADQGFSIELQDQDLI